MLKFSELPSYMQNDEVKEYYDILQKKKISLFLKRAFDIVVSGIMILLLLPVFVIIAILIKCDSKGPVMFRQVRITKYGKEFRIFKFRTMVNNADKIGSQVTTSNDARITKIGSKIRGVRLDELPQLFNVFVGDMSFVGTRPEVKKYVDCYTNEMYATLLLPAGITSEASIEYKDEEKLLAGGEDTDSIYVNQVLPQKMKYNLDSIKKFNIFSDIKTMIRTVFAVLK